MNKYYVYIHRRSDNGEIFYVGKGTGKRSHKKDYRNKNWNLVVEEAGGFIVEYLHSGITNDEAITLENKYLTDPDPDWKLVNVAKASTVNQINSEMFSEWLYYDETSPSGLRWKNVSKTTFKVSVGDVAGRCCPQGRWQLELQGKNFYTHRVVAALNGMSISGFIVDHIDGNPSNNVVSNLRCITQAENARNLKFSSANMSGISGVHYDTTHSAWKAEWNSIDGLRKSKSFSESKYGKEEAFRLACEWRKNKIEELNAAGAGYTDRHGT